MKILKVFVSIMFLSGCQPSTIKWDRLESVRIMSNQRDFPKDTVVVTDTERIREITTMIKEAKKEPIKFYADYKVELWFKDTMILLLVRNDLLNNEGVTYKLKRDLGKKLDEIINAAY